MTNTFKKIGLLVACIAAIVPLILIFSTHSQKKGDAYVKEANNAFLSISPAKQPPPSQSTLNNASENWKLITIQPGDSLARIFKKLHIPYQDLSYLLKSHTPHLTMLTPGEQIKFLTDQQNHLLSLQIPVSVEKSLAFNRINNKFEMSEINHPLDIKLAFKSGKVTHSLLESMLKAGISNKLSHDFIQIFQSKVNFKRDIRSGDQFAILYDEYYTKGKKHHNGNIVAAEIITHNNTYHAINYNYPKKHSAYYSPDGKSLTHRFLTYPLKYKRISSRFSHSRMDPIAHKKQPHLGVDFAATPDTPIKSIGNGYITYIGRDRGYGNAIKIRYDKHYSALYGHMKHFAKNLKLHQYIHRGETIGYVGSTGWSTGPHLHFSFYVNGKAKNWLLIKPPYNPPIPNKDKNEFNKNVKNLLTTLALYQTSTLTENSNNGLSDKIS